jgi:Fe-S-cluster containining protein
MWTITPETEKDIMEQGRWLAYHRCDILRFKDGGKEKIGIKIPLTCQQLKYIPGTGYTCKIYDSRPKTCKMYTCDNFTAEEAAKIKQQKGGE